MKTRKSFRRLLMMIFTVSLLLLSGCSNNNATKKAPQDEYNKHPFTIVGFIDKVNQQELMIHNEKDKPYTFLLNKTKIHNRDQLVKGDHVKITYLENRVKNKKNKACEIWLINPIEIVDRAQSILNAMSIEEKVGQMFFVRTPVGSGASDAATYHLGGYILFDRDVRPYNKDGLRNQLQSYQDNSKIKMLIGIDEEGGSVNRLSRYLAYRGAPFLSPQALYAQGGMDLILSDAKEKAELLNSLGINVNLAPVSDVSTNPSDFINARSFGKDANQTADYIGKVVTTMNENHIGSVLKHFPGYGNNVDTHTGIAYDKRPYENFLNNDFKPFEAGFNARAQAVLVAHNIVDSMDPNYPASLSKPVHDILRNTLHFRGVIMTDDLDMEAIKDFIGTSSPAVFAIKAGNDLVMCGNYQTQIPDVLAAIQNQEISEQQINESVHRILTWKLNMNMIQ
ncbi:MAG: glycoside hydrolase family 3 N-terminal domain-containing protein [Erysipelotrichaceae bacterium]